MRWALVAAVLLMPRLVAAQEPSGRIEGGVYDQTGQPLAGVRVVVTLPPASTPAVAVSDREGRFVVAGLVPGEYRLRASAPKIKRYDAVVMVGTGTVELNVIMEVEGQADPIVGCVFIPPLVHTGTIAPALTIDADFMQGLPLPLGRSPLLAAPQMLSPAAAAVSSFRAYGAAAEQNAWRVEGFELGDLSSGRLRLAVPAFAAAGTQLTMGPVADAAPEAPGALVELATFSGSNHPEVAAAMVGEADGKGRAGQTGLRVGGPLVRDHAWAAAALELTGTGENGEASTRSWRGYTKLNWLANPRSKFTLLALLDDEAQDGARTTEWLVGLISESLLSDTLVLRVQLGAIGSRARLDPVGWQNRTGAEQVRMRLEWFSSYGRIDHDVSVELRGSLARDEVTVGTTDQTVFGSKAIVVVADRARLTRYLTLQAGLAWVGDSAGMKDEESALSVAGAVPHAGLVWDATHDRRTALRASVEQRLDAGRLSLAHTVLPDVTQAPALTLPPATGRTTAIAAGAERDILAFAGLGVQALYQRFQTDRVLALTVHAQRPYGHARFLTSYTATYTERGSDPWRPPPHAFAAHVQRSLGRWLTAGGSYRLAAGLPAPASTAHEAGLRIQLDLRRLELPVNLFADAVWVSAGERERLVEQEITLAAVPSRLPAWRGRLGITTPY